MTLTENEGFETTNESTAIGIFEKRINQLDWKAFKRIEISANAAFFEHYPHEQLLTGVP